MPAQRPIAQILAVSAMALVFSISAQAGASRTFVATTGNDGNTSANCGAVTPCRTFGAALSVTNPGGELVVLTSGGYGPATISQPVIITAIGIDASISQPNSGASGLILNTTGNITLIGLNLHGEGTGSNGILVQQIGFLRLYNMLIENFTTDGVEFNTGSGAGELFVSNSAFNDNGNDGIQMVSGVDVPKGYIEYSQFDHNLAGAAAHGAQMTIAESSATNNEVGYLSVALGTLTLFHDVASFNVFALSAGNLEGPGQISFDQCMLTDNTNAWTINGGSTITGTSPGTSFIGPNQTMTGTLSTPTALQ